MMNNLKRQSGQALVIVLLLLTAGMFLSIFLVERTVQHSKSSVMDERIQATEYLAGNPITDILRQMSQNYYMDHYGSDVTKRSADFYDVGFSDIKITPDRSKHTLFIQVAGKYGNDVDNPQDKTTMTALVKFISHMTGFGTYLNQDFNSGGSVTYDGPFWINGDWNMGSGVVNNGTVYVKGDISGGPDTINGDLYYGGTKGSNITVNGNAYNYFPLGNYPSISTEYYEYHYNQKFTAADEETYTSPAGSYVKLTFNSDGTIKATTAGGVSTISIPSIGLIIYGSGCDILCGGVVHGRVTVVADNIYISTGVTYANGLGHANASDSFAAMAVQRLYWNNVLTTGITVYGAYFQGDNSNDIGSNQTFQGTFHLIGTRNRGVTYSDGTHQYSPVDFDFDPYLDQYPPPGLPERPKLVNLSIR